jgi:hypothetical protein
LPYIIQFLFNILCIILYKILYIYITKYDIICQLFRRYSPLPPDQAVQEGADDEAEEEGESGN